MRVHQAHNGNFSTDSDVGQITYDTIAEAIAADVPSRGLQTGTQLFINTGAFQDRVYVLDRENTAAPNGDTIIATNPLTGGNWLLAFTAGSGDVATVTEIVPFTFQDGIIEVEPVRAGSRFLRAVVVVDTAFNGVLPTLTLGTDLSPSLVLGTTDSDLTTASQYESPSLILVPADSTVRITVTPNGSMQGSGIVMYERTA